MKTKALLLAACAIALAGCDYTVSLVKTPERAPDDALVGLWERTTLQGEVQRLLVLPLNDTEFLLSFPAGSKDAMFARVTQTEAAGLPLLQLTWFGTAQGVTPDDARIYQYAACTVEGDTLKGRLLNADVVDRESASPAALVAAIEANRQAAKLFRDTWEFTRVKAPETTATPPKRPPIPAAWR